MAAVAPGATTAEFDDALHETLIAAGRATDGTQQVVAASGISSRKINRLANRSL